MRTHRLESTHKLRRYHAFLGPIVPPPREEWQRSLNRAVQVIGTTRYARRPDRSAEIRRHVVGDVLQLGIGQPEPVP
jgi:hypothetical protein